MPKPVTAAVPGPGRPVRRRTGIPALAGCGLLLAGLLTAVAPTAAAASTPVPETAAPVAAAVATAAPAGGFVPVPAARLLDTVADIGRAAPLGAGRSLSVQVAGRAGIPATGVAAVTVRLTALAPSAPGWLAAYAHGTARPRTTALNWAAGRSTGSAATVAVSADGRIDLTNLGGRPVDLAVDVSGYFAAGRVTAAGAFVPVTPARSLDTRAGIGASRADWADVPAGSGRTLSWQLAGRTGVPLGAGAAVVSLTATNATGPGRVSAVESDGRHAGIDRVDELTAVVPVRGLAVDAGAAATDLFVVPLAADGLATVDAAGLDSVDVIVDVVGYLRGGPATTPGSYQPLPAARVRTGTVAAGSTTVLRLPVPAGSTAVLTVDAGDVSAPGALFAYPHGTRRPSAALGVLAAGRPTATTALVRVSTGGTVDVANVSGGAVDLTVDLLGYFRECAPSPRTVWSWGDNTDGQLGQGSSSAGSSVPAPVAALRDVRAVDGSGRSAFAIRTDGSLWAWGKNSNDDDAFSGGQLGDGTAVDRWTPVRVRTVHDVTQVVSDGESTYALQADGTVWSWGAGTAVPGAEPDDPITASEPVRVAGLGSVVSISTDYPAVYAVRGDGTVWSWRQFPGSVPAPVAGLTGIRAVSGSTLLRTDGRVQVGTAPVPGLTNITAIDGPYALRSDGTVWTRDAVQVPGLTGVRQLGSGHAVTSTGALWRLDGASVPQRVDRLPRIAAVAGTAGSAMFVVSG
ncbi:RCC1 domain-containing protein [Nakamurella endophytica]|uniref:Alpha-tubulin suppressor-like RCC1 family protein n=1 Tax=Nakamurella endophytica TaxID=1748367 RepID=A0A917T1J4_9ACTN|nr:hypothetical protein [Nakamurella endophytica]GGM06998.1 hypothetical protein GCM10011594_28790 [Nakamurella endophytica]